VSDESHRDRRQHDEAGRQHQDGAFGCQEIPQRHEPAIREEQRRHEAQKEKPRVQLDERETRPERKQAGADNVANRQRPGQPASDHVEYGEEQDEDERVFEAGHEERRRSFNAR
jgi:hypothetical protein